MSSLRKTNLLEFILVYSFVTRAFNKTKAIWDTLYVIYKNMIPGLSYCFKSSTRALFRLCYPFWKNQLRFVQRGKKIQKVQLKNKTSHCIGKPYSKFGFSNPISRLHCVHMTRCLCIRVLLYSRCIDFWPSKFSFEKSRHLLLFLRNLEFYIAYYIFSLANL